MGFFNVFAKKQKNITSSSKRSFKAASFGPLASGLPSSDMSAEGLFLTSGEALRSRARFLCNNNDYAKRFLGLANTYVLGEHGIIMQAKEKGPTTTRSYSKESLKTLEQTFRDWAHRSTCEVTGTMNWNDVQELVLKTLIRDGEVIVRKIKGAKNRFGFTLQLLEPDHLDEQANFTHSNGNEVRLGIERDEWGKVVAYWILKKHPSAMYGVARSYKRDYQRIAAEEIIHLFVKERISQTRGITFFHTAIISLKNLEKYQDSELIASTIAAQKMGFYTSPIGDNIMADEEDDEGNFISNSEPGQFEVMPKGYSLQTFDPQHPTTGFQSFVKSILRGVSSGLGVNYNNLSGDLEGVNFSSLRQGEITQRDFFKVLQQWFIRHFLQEVWEDWLEMALLKKVVPIAFADYKKFVNPKWQTRGFDWVDPVKSVKANVEAYKNGFKTLEDILAESGKDLEETLEQRKKEKELLQEYGLSFDEVITSTENQNLEEKNEETEEESWQ